MFESVDCLRRRQGELLDALGIGPRTMAGRPVVSLPGATLRDYGGGGPALLIVPAPIKRPYIWDLLPEVSVVRRCLEAGLRVFMIDWDRPGEEAADWGIEHYVLTLIDGCAREVVSRTGGPVVVASHSLGGTLAALHAAARPGAVGGLVLLEAPLKFGDAAGAFAPLAAAAPDAEALRRRIGNPPGTLLDMFAIAAAPDDFIGRRWRDWLDCANDPQALRLHVAVMRWTLDEAPLAARLHAEIVVHLYRDDLFLRRRLVLGGRRLDPVLRLPVFTVASRQGRVVPASSVLPFHDAVVSPVKRLAWVQPERGTALDHLAVLVGRGAHARLWPEITAWVKDVSKT